MKRIILLGIIVLIGLVSCSLQNTKNTQPFLEIENTKYSLGISTKTEVEKNLGKASSEIFVKQSTDDFFKSDYSICSYEGDKLVFYYNNENKIVRFRVESSYSKSVTITLGPLSNLTSNKVEAAIKKIPQLLRAGTDSNTISYFAGDTLQQVVSFHYLFDNNNKLKSYDVTYYTGLLE